MSLSTLLGIGTAQAATAVGTTAAQQPSNPWTMFLFPLLIVVFFYFVLIRPQAKRAKEQKALLERINVGEEVLTIGGIVGRVTRLKDSFLVLRVAENVEITMQKSSIASVLPKGTLDV